MTLDLSNLKLYEYANLFKILECVKLKFKGVSAGQIADSIQSARVFVKELGDPVISNYFDIITSDQVQAIRDAGTQQELFDALQLPKAVLNSTAKLFVRHGFLDTNGTGHKVASDLAAWTDLDYPAVSDTFRAIEEHVQAYPGPTAEQEAAYVQDITPSFVHRNVIVCEPQEVGEVEALANSVVEPFRLKGEVELPGVYLDYHKDGLAVLEFRASSEAARAVAAAVPHRTVLDNKGQIVKDVSSERAAAFKPEEMNLN